MSSDSENPNDIFSFLVKTLEIYDKKPAKAGEILSEHSISTYQNRLFRPVCQFIFLTVLRNKILFESCLESFSNKIPRSKLKCTALAAMAEIFGATPEKYAKATHSWVEFSKKYCSLGEAKFLNAFLRKFPVFIQNAKKEMETFSQKLEFFDKNSSLVDREIFEAFLKKAEIYFSHPAWLIKKWVEKFGLKKALEILESNQKASEVFFRISKDEKFAQLVENFKDSFEISIFENFYILKRGHWENMKKLLSEGAAYIQDPSTAEAPKLLAPKCGETILDLCAAPGGKSAMIADLVFEDFLQNAEKTNFDASKLASLVALDFGQTRINLLKENFSKSRFSHLNSKIVNFDLSRSAEDFAIFLKEKNLPEEFDAVLLDAPCSNSGVLGRRPDARYRISESDIPNCSKIQLQILQTASKFVRTGGRIVYSTCSIEDEENAMIAKNFLLKNPNFKLLKNKETIPDNFNDGSNAFLFERIS